MTEQPTNSSGGSLLSLTLLPYQVPSAANLLRSLRENRVAVDASDTGTGKTYVAASVASELRRVVGVICPKAVIPQWQRIFEPIGGNLLFVVNYEKLRAGNTSWGRFNVKKWEWSPTIPNDALLIWDECFHPSHELLTLKGWVGVSEITDADHVAQVNADTGIITFARPVEVVSRQFSGNLCHLSNGRYTDFLVTPNHEHLVYPGWSNASPGPATKVPFNDLTRHGFYQRVAGNAPPVGNRATPLERFMIAFQADGHYLRYATRKKKHYVRFMFRRDRKIIALRRLLDELPFPWKETVNCRGDTSFCVWVADEHPPPKSLKWLPLDRSLEFYRSVLDEIVLWDGWRSEEGGFFESDLENAEWVQIIASLAGHQASLIPIQGGRYWRVRWSTHGRQIRHMNGSRMSDVPYDGIVHCVRVPEGNVITRRDGHIGITGNCHRAKSPTSQNARMLMTAKPFHNLLLSATLAQDPTEMRALGYLLGLHTWLNFYKWCLRNGCWKGRFGGIEFKVKTATAHLLALHEQIFPRFGSRVRIADLGDAFPDNHVSAEVYSFGNEAQVNAAYDEATEEKNRRILADEPVNGGALLMQARQEAEVLKADGLASMATDLIAEGNSVVVFTCFRETLAKLCAKLKCPGIFGGQSQAARQQAIDDFQADKARAIVVNVQAGGVGISLNDVLGAYPRVSLICPTDSAVDLKQALGRIHRQGSKSKAVQKLVFAAGTYEEKVCKRVQGKLANIALLQDGDLDPLAPDRRVSNEISQTETLVRQVADTRDITALQPPEITAERKHAPLSPSALKAKIICAGFRNDEGGDKSFAEQGTRGHKAVEEDDAESVDEVPPGEEVEEMLDDDPDLKAAANFGNVSKYSNNARLKAAVEKCIGYKKHLIARFAGAEVYQEARLPYYQQWGFADLILVLEDKAVCADWKFALRAYEADAPQFWAYCAGIWDKWLFVDEIEVHVANPFRDEVDKKIFSRKEHYETFFARIAATEQRVLRNDPADYVPSKQCGWCGLAGKCSALARLGVEVHERYLGEKLVLPEGSLHGSEINDPETFAALLPIRAPLRKALGSWGRAATEMVDAGGDIPGYEMATKEGRRRIDSAKGVFDLLKAEVAPDLKAEDFLEDCAIKPTAIDSIVKAATKRGQKGKSVKLFEARLRDEGLLSRGAGSRYLQPTRA